MPPKPVAIFRDHLLPSSQTFIRNQAEALRRFRAYYFGCRFVPGLALAEDRTCVLNTGAAIGWAREACCKLLPGAAGLARPMRRVAPVLIHAHFGPDGSLILPVARRLGVPLVITFHGYDATTRDEAALRSHLTHRGYIRQRAQLQQCGQTFIAVSNFIRHKLVERGFPAPRTFTHYVGVDTSWFRPDTSRPRERIVLFVGRLVHQKGVHVLIRALAARSSKEGVELVLVGDGAMRGELAQLASCLGVRARFLGTQRSEAVRDVMNRASVLCGPSLIEPSGEEEGFGLSFIEAQAMRLPVVATATGGIGEAVSHGETGFLCPPGDADALRAHLDLLLRDASLRFTFGMAGRRRAMARFDLVAQTKSLEAIYDESVDAYREARFRGGSSEFTASSIPATRASQV